MRICKILQKDLETPYRILVEGPVVDKHGKMVYYTRRTLYDYDVGHPVDRIHIFDNEFNSLDEAIEVLSCN